MELSGTGVSPGIAVGRVLVLEREAVAVLRTLQQVVSTGEAEALLHRELEDAKRTDVVAKGEPA